MYVSLCVRAYALRAVDVCSEACTASKIGMSVRALEHPQPSKTKIDSQRPKINSKSRTSTGKKLNLRAQTYSKRPKIDFNMPKIGSQKEKLNTRALTLNRRLNRLLFLLGIYTLRPKLDLEGPKIDSQRHRVNC